MAVFDASAQVEQAGELDGILGLDKADEGWHVSLSKSESRSRSSKKVRPPHSPGAAVPKAHSRLLTYSGTRPSPYTFLLRPLLSRS
jgi:hypothetical protein